MGNLGICSQKKSKVNYGKQKGEKGQYVYAANNESVISFKRGVLKRSELVNENQGVILDQMRQSQVAETPYADVNNSGDGAAQTQLTDIQINNINDLAHDRWQFLKAKGSNQFVDFDLMDKLVIQACQMHQEELQAEGQDLEQLVPVSGGRVVNLKRLVYFVHDQPKQILKVRNYCQEASNPLEKSVGSLAEKLLQDSITGRSSFRETTTKNQNWKNIEDSWVGSEWMKINAASGGDSNPSLTQIKEGLQRASLEELMLTEKMHDNQYMQQAQDLRIQIWEIIFSKIEVEDVDQPIPEDSLWAKRDCCPIVQALLQIYYLMSSKIVEASIQKEEKAIEMLGPLAHVMTPIAYGIHNRNSFKQARS